jgi:hypothetical protein
MAADDYTNSSLTSEPDNLTELHRISGLPTEHQSRTTKTGFVIRPGRLPNCVPLPASNVLPRSWIWLHGEPIGVLNTKNEVTKHWLCRECYQDNVHHPLLTYLLNVEKKTNKPLDHLEQVHHYDRFGNKLGQSMSKKRKHGSIKPWVDQSTINNTIFDNAGWKTTYIRWVVSSGISLR